MGELNLTTDPERRTELLQAAQRDIAENYVNAYLFQMAKTAIQNVDLEGLWVNAPTQATDLTRVYWR